MELFTEIIVLIVGGILGALGTYLIKPFLDDWTEKRRKKNEAKEAARKTREEVTQQDQLSDQYALEYRDRLVWELRELRILDMVRPLDLERTYVRVKIKEAQVRRYASAEEMAALSKDDPNLLFELAQDKVAEEKLESLQPEKALIRYHHMAVLGDPGAGKTTMLKYLCLISAQAKVSGLPNFPVFVTLNRYAGALNTNFKDFIIDDVTDRYGFPWLRPFLERRLKEGTVLLLLDGLDEVMVGSLEEAEDTYRHVANEINHLVLRYPKCPVIVTSRRAGWKGLLVPSFRTMTLLDFSWDDIRRFIDNWFGEGSNRARKLQAVLAQQVRMQALAANPLLLSLISIVFEQDLELPERRAKLYERCVQVLLTGWDAHRGIKRAAYFTTDRKRDLLEDIALHFHSRGLRYFPKDELLEVIAAYLPSINIQAEQASLVLDEISAQHGLLKEQAADWYGFLHLTLQEYFTAVSLDKGNRSDLALTHLHNPWWEEVILLLAGMIKDATPLLNAILSDRDDIFFSNLLLAGRCLAGTPRIRKLELREQICKKLKVLIENEKLHWLPRTQAIRIIREAEGAASVEYFLKLLHNSDIHWQVRAVAVDVLGATGNKTVARDLMAALPNEQIDLNLRVRISDVLIHLCDGSTSSELMPILLDPAVDPQIRGNIARTLGMLGYQRAANYLLTLLSDQKVSNYIAWYASRALGDLKALSDPKDLRKLLGDENVNLVARWALAKSIENLDPTTYAEIIEWISDERLERGVRWNIARWIGRLNPVDENIKSELLRLYLDESIDPSVRACIGIGLLYLGDREMAGKLKGFLANPKTDLYVKKKIAESLVKFGEKEIAPLFISIMQEEAPSSFSFVRTKMADLLADLGDSTVASQLLDFLWKEDVDPLIRSRAADALSALRLNGLLTRVRTLVVDQRVDPLVRGRAAKCLAQSKNGVDELIKLLEHNNIVEEVYLALYFASRQAGVRVFATPEGEYEISPSG